MDRAYEAAMIAFQRHLAVDERGRLVLDAGSGPEIGIDDPVVFADLKRSLEETNRKIQLGEIDLAMIRPYVE